MRVQFHPDVRQNVRQALRRYRAVSERLAEEFKAELRRLIAAALANPKRFHPIKPGFHRANFRRFPYLVVYREIEDGIRIVLVRHHKRHPEFGMERK
jgi:plasmid stabilization system protein ParE